MSERASEWWEKAQVGAWTGGALAHSLLRTPRAPVAVPVRSRGAAPPLAPGAVATLLVWNVQFCAGRRQRFFYDGGTAVRVPEADWLEGLARVGRALETQRPDIVMLQEVDRGSDRTQRVDQHAELLTRCSFPTHVSAPYHRNRYVPYPPHEHLGRMDLHLSVFSRYHIERAVRWPLPPLREGWLRRQFNLRRAALEVQVAVEGAVPLRLFDVHLSAFSAGDGTLPDQVGALRRSLGHDGPILVAGDFNALPPGTETAGLFDRHQYETDRDVLAPLFDGNGFTAAIGLEAHEATPQRYRTWMPHGQDTADRAIDHVFVNEQVEVLDATVLTGVHQVSDHLPLRVEFRVRA